MPVGAPASHKAGKIITFEIGKRPIKHVHFESRTAYAEQIIIVDKWLLEKSFQDFSSLRQVAALKQSKE